MGRPKPWRLDRKQMDRRPVDRSYIAPQLTPREKLVAGAFVVLDTCFFLFGIGTSVLVYNLFSETFPRREKLVDAGVLLAGFALIAAVVTWILYRLVGGRL